LNYKTKSIAVLLYNLKLAHLLFGLEDQIFWRLAKYSG